MKAYLNQKLNLKVSIDKSRVSTMEMQKREREQGSQDIVMGDQKTWVALAVKDDSGRWRKGQ
jgi:hypothetical protein